MPGSNSSPGSESPHSHSHSPPLPQSAPSPPQELSHLPSPSPVSPLRSPPRSPSCQHPELSQLPRFLSPTPSPSPSPPQTFRNLLFDHISGIHDMCEMARSGEISDITGRDKEIRRVIEIMCRKTKNSVVLIGEPGVGKTAIAEGLAHRIVTGEVPEDLRGSIYAVDVNELSFGSGLREIISAAIESQSQGHPAIIFIDELHVLLARGDAANLLKPALARGQLRLLGATTLSEYREHIETDAALERRFSTVIVNEPSPEQTIAILRGLRAHYEGHHNVRIMDEALETAVDFSRKYLAARRLPDSAIDLLDEACAAAKLLRFMKPDKVYDIEQEISNLSKRIESLEKDSHLEYEILVQKAKNRRSELKLALNDLQQQHEGLKSWWRDIDTHRKSVKDYKEELDKATNESGTTTERLLEQTQTFKESQRVLHELERRPIEYDSRLVGIPDLVTPATVAEVIERATKIPIGRLMASDKERLLKLEDALNAKVIGQPEAVKAVARAIKISRMGLANIDKPIATLLFTGSSGTGKTLLAKTLAEELFGHSSAMIRFDGSEYTSDTETTRLVCPACSANFEGF